MIMSGKKNKYFPNNWSRFKAAPDDMFFTPTYEEFKEWKLRSWELPESVECIIRAEENGKIKEYVYEKQHAALKRVNKLLESGATFTICDNESIQSLPFNYDLDD